MGGRRRRLQRHGTPRTCRSIPAGWCAGRTGSVSTPSQFYQHTIQPVWNGKCVACHVAGGAASFRPLTEGVSYGELVPAKVVAGNDNPAAAGNVLLDRITRTGAGRMPQN